MLKPSWRLEQEGGGARRLEDKQEQKPNSYWRKRGAKTLRRRRPGAHEWVSRAGVCCNELKLATYGHRNMSVSWLPVICILPSSLNVPSCSYVYKHQFHMHTCINVCIVSFGIDFFLGHIARPYSWFLCLCVVICIFNRLKGFVLKCTAKYLLYLWQLPRPPRVPLVAVDGRLL